MLPVLLEIGEFKLFSYPMLLVSAFLVGNIVALKQARTLGIDQAKVLKLNLHIVFVSLIGARLFFALGAWQSGVTQRSFWELTLNGGLAFYGGLIASLLYLLWKLPREKLPANRFFNCLAPSVAIAHAIGRFGCFLNGCCHGKHCDLVWAIQSKSGPVHPSQIYEIIGLIVIFFLCSKNNSRPSSRPSWLIYLYGYSLLRFFVEFTRGDSLRGEWGPFSSSQWVSIALFLTSLFLDLNRKQDHNHRPHET